MPIRFNQSVGKYDDDLNPVVPVGSPDPTTGQPSNVGTYNGAAIGSILDSLTHTGGKQGENSLGAYSVEAADILDQTSGYSRAKEEILQGLNSATDKQTINDYYNQFSRLRRGEIQGALDPLSAATRLNALTKKYITRYPGLALKFRQIHNGVISDIPAISGATGHEVDPEIEAMNKITQEAVSRGWSNQDVINLNQSEAVDKAQQLTFAARARTGVASQNDLAASVYSRVSTLYAGLIPQMTASARDPNFQGMSWFTDLSARRGQLALEIDQTITAAQQAGGFTLTKEYQDQVKTNALAPLDSLIEIAKSVDNPKLRLAASDALRKLTENGDYMNLHKQLGPAVTLFGGNAESMYKYLDGLSDVSKKLQSGQQGQLEALAQYDIKTRMMLDSIKSNGWPNYIADNVRKIDTDAPWQSTGNPVNDKLDLQVQLNYSVAPTTEGQDKEKAFTYVAGSPDIFEALDKRPDVLRQFKYYQPAVDRLKSNSSKLLVEQSHQTDVANMRSIQFDASKPNPFSLPSQVIGVRKDGPVFGGIYGENLEYADSHRNELVDRLNQQYRVLGQLLSRPEAQKWAANTIDELIASQSDSHYLEQRKKNAPAPTNENTTVTPDSALIAEAKQAGMTVDEYKVWINTPAK